MNRIQVIIILGSTNSPEGEISPIGLQRLDKGAEIYKNMGGIKILLTGGYSVFGNKSEFPYSYFAEKYLISIGVKEADILPLVLSKDTIEDAKLSLPVIKEFHFHSILVVTSNFHMERTKYIFNRVFSSFKLTYEGIDYITSESEIRSLIQHEQDEMKLLQETGQSSLGSKL